MAFEDFWFSKTDEPTGASLRFSGGQSLFRDFGAPTGTHNLTNNFISVWVKFSNNNQSGFSQSTGLFSWELSATLNGAITQVSGGDWRNNVAGTIFSRSIASTIDDNTRWTPVRRDPGAWYHLFFSYVGTGANACVKNLYVNGVLQPTTFNVPTTYNLFRYFSVGSSLNDNGSLTYVNQLDGYISDFFFVQRSDGSTVSATDFGQFDANGVWVPLDFTTAKANVITAGGFGTNGFALNFDSANFNSGTLVWADQSGNGNDFLANWNCQTGATSPNISTDIVKDGPVNNYALWNSLRVYQQSQYNQTYGGPVKANSITYGDTNSSFAGYTLHSVPMGTSGSYDINLNITPGLSFAVATAIGTLADYNTTPVNINSKPCFSYYWGNGGTTTGAGIYQNGSIVQAATGYATGSGGTAVSFRVVVDRAANTATFYVPVLGANLTPTTVAASVDISSKSGQELYLAVASTGILGNTTSLFYIPGSDLLNINTNSLAAATIPNGSTGFQAILDTGANILTTAQATFPSGLWWVKDRANANEHQLVDIVRGTGNAVYTSSSTAAQTAYVAPAGNSVAWCWEASSTFTNTAGSNGATMNSSGVTNRDTGFSIVTWVGNGSADGRLYHNLGAAPTFIIYRYLNTSPLKESIVYYYSSLFSTSYRLTMNSSSGGSSGVIPLANSQTFSNAGYAGPAANVIAWLWAPIPGYSSFGEYVGNANADGPFVYTGFKPALVITKCYSTGGVNWQFYDNVRNTYNPETLTLQCNLTSAESTLNGIDFLSNGFKIRTSSNQVNASPQTFIYAAFAENPFGGSNVAPVTAR
jgi:hypothetical protein